MRKIIIPLLCMIGFNGHAITIENYTQAKKGDIYGTVTLSDIKDDDAYVSVRLSDQPVEFQIIKNDSTATLIISSNTNFSKNDFITVITQNEQGDQLARNFKLNTNIGTIAVLPSGKEPVQEVIKSTAKVSVNRPRNKEAIFSDADNSKSLLITIDRSRSVRTIREAVEFLSLVNEYTIISFPRDAFLLDLPLTNVVSLSSYNELYALSNNQIKEIFIDDKNKLIRLSATNTIPAPVANPLKRLAPVIQKVTIEDYFNNYAFGYTLLDYEQDSNARLLLVDDIAPLSIEYTIKNIAKNKNVAVFVDNQNKLVRITNIGVTNEN